MRKNRIICLFAIVGICMVQTAVSHTYSSTAGNSQPAAAHGSRVAQSDFRWREQIAPGRAIEINGVYGNIRAEVATGNEVEVIATKHAVHSDPNQVQLSVLKHNNGVTICAVYPNSGVPNQCQPGDMSSHVHNNDVHVDFTVRVPANVRFVARAVEGDIEAVSLKSNVEAFSAMGNVRISTAGYARAKTITGSIIASMGDAAWSNRLEFESVTGEITLSLPATTNAEVHAESITGDISTEFPMTVKGSFSSRSVEGVIGKGGRQLSLKTISGPIKLLRVS